MFLFFKSACILRYLATKRGWDDIHWQYMLWLSLCRFFLISPVQDSNHPEVWPTFSHNHPSLVCALNAICSIPVRCGLHVVVWTQNCSLGAARCLPTASQGCVKCRGSISLYIVGVANKGFFFFVLSLKYTYVTCQLCQPSPNRYCLTLYWAKAVEINDEWTWTSVWTVTAVESEAKTLLLAKEDTESSSPDMVGFNSN